ncbi:hypothetical protein AB4156_32440 [Cupriavidus sp. 2MCAB6]|uniref:hypothetical protein n=1 Tax=Cupriavidus sp. 2MCAB6 TaxID=3232981 RepID=UPI003F8DFAF1
MAFYIGIEEARTALAEIGINLSSRQLKRAADPDAYGKRKLPFFVDPIDKRLKIERGTLLEIYTRCQVHAENNALINPKNLKDLFDRNS